MLDMPMLKFEKSTKYLQNQLEIQQNNKQLISDIISNIGLILNKETVKDENKLNSALDSANLFLQTITNNITTIEQLNLEIKNITKELSEIVSEKGKPSKTKEFYIAAFTNIKQNIVIYSKKIKQLEDKLSKDNAEFDDFINENNIQFNFETVSTSEDDSDNYKFTGFSLDEDNTSVESEEVSSEENTSVEPEEVPSEENSIIEGSETIEVPEEFFEEAEESTIPSEELESVSEEEVAELTDDLEESDIVNNFETYEEPDNNFDYDSLISDTIKESTDIKPNYLENYSEDFSGFNVDHIMSQFSLAKIEEKIVEENIVEEKVNEESIETSNQDEISEESPTSEADVQINENDISEDMDSLLDLLSDEDFEEINEDISINSQIKELLKDPSEDLFSENNLDDGFASLENSFKSFDNVLKSNTELPVEETISETELPVLEESSNSVEEFINLDDLSDINLDEETNLIEENIFSNKQEDPKGEPLSDVIVAEKKQPKPIDYANKIAKIEEGNCDNETLLISERTEKIYLPYKTSELLNYIHSYPNLYTSLSDVVKQEFILPFTYFSAHPRKSRFSEAYSLMRNREGKGFFASTSYAFKISRNGSLNPAIIASCKTKEELESYLECLSSNKLDKFKTFNIDYEVNPV